MSPFLITIIAIGIAATFFNFVIIPRLAIGHHRRKLKSSSKTSSIIMQRFMMLDTDNEPFTGLHKPAKEVHDTLADVGAWTKDVGL